MERDWDIEASAVVTASSATAKRVVFKSGL